MQADTAHTSAAAHTISPSGQPAPGPIRYFAVTYFDGGQAMDDSANRSFRAKKMQRARRIAMSFMPWNADRMEIVEINGHEFEQHRAKRKDALANPSRNRGQTPARPPASEPGNDRDHNRYAPG